MLDLYKDLIIDHGVNPRNKYVMTNFTNFARGFNYFCGDKFDLYICISNSLINEISFNGVGCSVSTASASLLTFFLKNKSLIYAESLFVYFTTLIKDINAVCYDDSYYELNVLSNVRNYPARVKCATLIWHTLVDALKFDLKR